jgi:hypothetical protein
LILRDVILLADMIVIVSVILRQRRKLSSKRESEADVMGSTESIPWEIRSDVFARAGYVVSEYRDDKIWAIAEALK